MNKNDARHVMNRSDEKLNFKCEHNHIFKSVNSLFFDHLKMTCP